MALSYGFFNSLDGDRKYDAKQMAQIFDGILNDGVFQSIGEYFATKPGTGLQVKVGPGRAWFNSTWTLSDADIPLSLAVADVTLGRYDAVVLEVDHSQAVRANSIKVLTGTPGTNPVKPALTNSEDVHQHPLAYVYVGPGATSITAANIQVVVGTSACPFVTGILETADIDALFAQWDGQFNTWFANVQAQLSGDIAANLQRQIDDVLKPATKTLFGLSESAIPDDVFAFLGKYNQHWWRRRAKTVVEVKEDITGTVDLTQDSTDYARFYYSKTVSVDSTGKVSLNSPTTLYGVASSSSDASSLINDLKPYLDNTPYYVSSKNVDGKVYYVPPGSVIKYSAGNPGYFTFGLYRYSSRTFYMMLSDNSLEDVKVPAQLVNSSIQLGDWQYVQSSDRNAYPDSGTSGGYEYEYLGIPFDNAVTAPKIETGSYVGTGTAGSSAKNTLNFGLDPAAVIIVKDVLGGLVGGNVFIRGQTKSTGIGSHVNSGGDLSTAVVWANKAVSWYAGTSDNQLNYTGERYYYFAIGR